MARTHPVARPRPLRLDLPRIRTGPLLGILSLLVLVPAALALPAYPALARFRADALEALPNVLAPLVVLALFIERAVEVVLAGWRAAGATSREAELARALETGSLDRQWQARSELDLYTAESRQLAMVTAFAASMLISMSGVRAIEMLVADGLVRGEPPGQRGLFVWVDILITSLLLAGGAEGIHRVVNTFTAFMEQTRDRMRDPALRAGGAGQGAAAGAPAEGAPASGRGEG